MLCGLWCWLGLQVSRATLKVVWYQTPYPTGEGVWFQDYTEPSHIFEVCKLTFHVIGEVMYSSDPLTCL